MVHGRMDRNDDIGIMRRQAVLDAPSTSDFGMKIGTHFVQFGVGQVIKDFPLQGMCRHVFVRVYQGSVGKDAMIGPQIRQLVGTARILNEKLTGKESKRWCQQHHIRVVGDDTIQSFLDERTCLARASALAL